MVGRGVELTRQRGTFDPPSPAPLPPRTSPPAESSSALFPRSLSTLLQQRNAQLLLPHTLPHSLRVYPGWHRVSGFVLANPELTKDRNSHFGTSLEASGPPLSPVESALTETPVAKSFRIRTYEKMGRGGATGPQWHRHSCLCSDDLPSTRKTSPLPDRAYSARRGFASTFELSTLFNFPFTSLPAARCTRPPASTCRYVASLSGSRRLRL